MLIMFDLDDTLLETGAALTHARRRMLQRVGLRDEADLLNTWRRMTWYFRSEDLGAILPILARDCNQVLPEQDWGALLEEYWAMECESVAWKPSAQSTLDTLQEMGVQIGIICNGQRARQLPKLRQVGLWDRLNGESSIRICDGVAWPAKPQPDALRDLRRAKGYDTRSTCYVGDLPIDILAANLANITSLHLRSASLAAGAPPTEGAHILERPAYQIGDLSELPGMVEKLQATL